MTFVDTCYVVALVNRRDQFHVRARELALAYRERPVLTTDAILLEIGNALARAFKREAVEVIESLLGSAELEVVHLSPELFDRGFELYASFRDKPWGLIDCVSFVVMRDRGIREALTYDQHFVQAGFHALMRDPP
jgi:predicted nucleic acid-binding protein